MKHFPPAAIDAIEHQTQNYFEYQRNLLHTTLNAQYNFDRINQNDLNDSVEVLYDDFNDDNEW